MSSTGRMPVIFENAGVRAPVELLDPFLDAKEDEDAASVATEVPSALAPVPQQSVLAMVPKLVVLQYGLLALHTTTHDQVFYSYLMSSYESGGLGLDPGQFSQLIAIMSVAQTFYQFWMYPTLGPPRGRWSHLAMFRLGSALFVPSYVSVILYRRLAENLVMTEFIASTAVRYCATTFAFTSATILLNYLTPPPALGLAQRIASLTRFIGPALVAKVWETNVRDDPSGYALGFWVCAAVYAVAGLGSFTIR